MDSKSRGQAYLKNVTAKLQAVEKRQARAIAKAGVMMADAYEQDRLIHVYGGGGHTVMMVCEMFYRAGGFANINPIFGHDISPLCQARKYMEIERSNGYGACLIRYYGVDKDDLLIIFHNIGFNPTTIDAAEEAKKRGAKIIAISSHHWRDKLPKANFAHYPCKKHLFELADLCIDDENPYGDADYKIAGCDWPIGPTSTIVDAFVAQRLNIEAVAELVRRGIKPPIFLSGNVPDGDRQNAALLARYNPRVKDL